MIEDAVIIYRLARAPERRIFYVDVGNLPKQKAEEYVRGLMQRYRNKLMYDPNTGEMNDSRKHLSMLEDFWMPRREGGKGTEVSTLQGGQNLGEMEDVKYFQKKLFQSLNVPTSRLEESTGFNIGRASEISRDEVKFFKFVERLRMKFSEVFLNLLRVQLILKGIIREDEWADIEPKIAFKFNMDSHFSELKESEV
ncbi:MAG: portal protein, partial [Actinobacteria bacterium]|nr:portal protein [Actinomycetota bacterium]